MTRHRSSSGHSIKVHPTTYAKAVLAAETMGVPFGDWIEGALQSQLAQDRATLKDRHYEAACTQAAKELRSAPTRHEWEASRRKPG